MIRSLFFALIAIIASSPIIASALPIEKNGECGCKKKKKKGSLYKMAKKNPNS